MKYVFIFYKTHYFGFIHGDDWYIQDYTNYIKATKYFKKMYTSKHTIKNVIKVKI
jgi:hypothetical protein